MKRLPDIHTVDPLVVIARVRQEELRSLAAEIAQGRRARIDSRSPERRPLHARLIARVFGPR
jgi:hypothetical protein